MRARSAIKRSSGFTILEMILVLLLLAIAIVPMMDAFTPSLRSAKVTGETEVCADRALFTITRIIALDYSDLYQNQGNSVDLATLLSVPGSTVAAEGTVESFSSGGASYTPVVSILPFVNPSTSMTMTGALQVTVSGGPVQLRALRADY